MIYIVHPSFFRVRKRWSCIYLWGCVQFWGGVIGDYDRQKANWSYIQRRTWHHELCAKELTTSNKWYRWSSSYRRMQEFHSRKSGKNTRMLGVSATIGTFLYDPNTKGANEHETNSYKAACNPVVIPWNEIEISFTRVS